MIYTKVNSYLVDSNTQGKTGWKSPSNLAIVKYWGKYGIQLPRNPSLSLTLDHAHTIMEVEYKFKSSQGIDLNFTFEGQENQKFGNRIKGFLTSIQQYFPFLNKIHLKIKSDNSFPHSSGIASSASSMSALAMCLCDIENQLTQENISEDILLKKASFIARLGSGSASRSVYPYSALWGEHKDLKDSSNEYAIPYEGKVNAIFKTFHDDILIVSGKEKSVSSSAGHALMDNNVYASARYQQAHDRVIILANAMKEGDIETFGEIAEDEAMTLHALMMCSKPSYMLVEPGSISIMQAVRNYRRDTGHQVYFSLDAGPNIHLLYPAAIKQQVAELIDDKLKKYCYKGKVIRDVVGKGPTRV